MSDKEPIDVTSHYFVSYLDNPGVALIPVVLNRQNYQTWAKAMLRALEYRLWKINNSMTCSWIFNSLNRSLQGAAVHASDAKMMWDEIKQQFT
ncbi:hypothetical protein CRG98_020976 [Punica granatum]|uniref:Retrotransposon Copia-like N-terminal domain-containing protein n=1 Tax=Punica granatum TaxID=22663 RepID=A0A2I0JRZ0_PUNGR|nr:hypothetical protein CRG98_020976 [Punica granatum]